MRTPAGASCLFLPAPPASGAQGMLFVRSSTLVTQSHFIKHWPPSGAGDAKMKSRESLLLQDTQSQEGICLCNSQATLTFTLQRGCDHGAAGARRGKHSTLPQKRREGCPKEVVLTFTELHLKEQVRVFQRDKMEKGPPFLHTVVPPYVWGIHSKTPSGCLRPQIVPNPINTMFSFI